ncbi:hypothetical protein [Pseudaestuariivita atlantica]|nr:hypothetical protein [Pseudaestuariivita atlantica]
MSRVLAGLGTLCLALLAGAASLWAHNVTQRQPPLPDLANLSAEAELAATGQESDRATARRRPATGDYDAILERPLFAPTRRPVVIAALPEPEPDLTTQLAAPEAPAPVIRLRGVIGATGGNRALVTVDGADGGWLTEGTEVSGWTVTGIGPDWLDISRGEIRKRIDLYER